MAFIWDSGEWEWGEENKKCFQHSEETQFTSSVMCFTEQQFLPDILREPKDAHPIEQGLSWPAWLNYLPIWPGKTCPGMPKAAPQEWFWVARSCVLSGRGWYRGVDWALWHVDFHTEIGLQTVVIKGHRVINAPDTAIVCPLWTPTEENQGSLGTTAPSSHLCKELHWFTASN